MPTYQHYDIAEMSVYLEGLRNHNGESISKFRLYDNSKLYVEMYGLGGDRKNMVCFGPSTVFVRDTDSISEVFELESLFKYKVEINGTFNKVGKTWCAAETYVVNGTLEF